MAHTEPLRLVDLEPGTRVRDWTVADHIADGGSASVYRAEYVGIADKFPPKAVLRISGALGPSRAQATIEAYNRAPSSANVITVHQLFEWSQGEASHLVFVLEEADHTLADQMEQQHLNPEQGYELVKQIASGLDAYHRVGQVHGDVKPSNIMFSDGLWKLGDHAGAAPIQDDGKSTGATVHESSLSHRPPESFDDPTKAHRHGDIWALAVVAHEGVTGRQPFTSRRQQLVGPYNISPELGSDLEKFVAQALRLDPSKRPARQAGDLHFVEPATPLGVLAGDHAGLTTEAKTESKGGRKAHILLVGLVVLVLLAGAGTWLARRGSVRSATAIAPIVVTSESRPLFRWKAVPGAISYHLFVNQYGDNQVNGRIDRLVSTVDAGCSETAECELLSDVELEGSFEWWITTAFAEGADVVNEGSIVAIEPVATP